MGSPIVLRVDGLGHVPSFKNAKMILWRQRRIMTKPEYQVWMERVVESFVSQLRSELATRGIATTTGLSALSQIASLLPLDDSRKWIPAHCVSTQLVSKGNEGADITIERIE
ncbi:MAG: hypothetical protein QG602_2466 [Verrucomicrobiota bacterium]|nr:hypothetical protein [Verrucomicrobiota bacterium]